VPNNSRFSKYKAYADIPGGFLCLAVLNKGGVGKISYFLALCVDISKTVRDTTEVTTND